MGAVTTAFVKQFQANVMHTVQQKGSRLRNSVFIKSGIIGEEAYQDQIAPDTATKKTAAASGASRFPIWSSTASALAYFA